MMKSHRSLSPSLLILLISAAPARGVEQQHQVRLGSPAGVGTGAVLTECPTFTWSALPEAEGYRLVVYDASTRKEANRSWPLFEIQLPAGFSVFEHCLQPGHRYGWAVAATVGGFERWSEPAVFEILSPPAGDPSRRADASGDETSAPAPSPILTVGPAPGSDATGDGAPGLRPLPTPAFSLPPCTSMFLDVPAGNDFCPWIEQLARDRITDGCGGGNYCPKAPVTREQFALFLERSMRGTDTFRPGSTTADIPNRPPAATSFATPDSGAGQHTSITIGADGLGLSSYYDDTDDDLKAAHCSNVDCSVTSVATLDSIGDVGQHNSITIGPDGRGLISYYDATNKDLRLAHCSNASCSAATLTSPDSAGDVGQYTSITVGADGLGLISYYDATEGDLKVVHCSDSACSDGTFTSLDTGSNVGESTSITIGADGLGLIVYRYPGALQGNLKVAHCSNPKCSTASITPVVTTDDVGYSTSITIGADGLGLIGYYDAVDGDLEVAHCANIACSDGTFTSLDTAGDVGQYNSVTIGADGLPLIGYYDASDGALELAHCSNALCAPYFRRR